MTRNHDYNTPQQGATDWNVPLNRNFERLDSDVEIRDTEANRSEYAPKQGAKFLAIDSGTVSIGDGNAWQEIGALGSSKEVYASEFPGEDLSAKVRNAIQSLSNGKGRIRITPRQDGRAWNWTSELAINCERLGGAQIDIDDNCEIAFDVDGFALTVNNTPTTNNHPGQESRLKLTGGLWQDAGNPDGWLRIKDAIGCHIAPNWVRCYNDAGDATAVSIENHASYSESTHLEGRFGANRGIDFVPQSITGGSGGTNSFHDTYLENCHINATDFGMRFRGRFMYCTVTNPSLFCKADGARGMVMESGRMDGTTILGPKFESPGNFANTLGIETSGNFSGWYGPTIFGGYVGYGMDGWHEGQGSLSWLYHRQAGFQTDVHGNDDNIVLRGDDGSKYRVTVDNDGNLSTNQV